MSTLFSEFSLLKVLCNFGVHLILWKFYGTLGRVVAIKVNIYKFLNLYKDLKCNSILSDLLGQILGNQM